MRLGWLMASLAGGAVLLVAGAAAASPRPRRRATTTNEDRARIAKERLADFIRAARIDATARLDHLDDGLALGVTPGRGFVAEDAAALPRAVDGLDVWIDGWPR